MRGRVPLPAVYGTDATRPRRREHDRRFRSEFTVHLHDDDKVYEYPSTGCSHCRARIILAPTVDYEFCMKCQKPICVPKCRDEMAALGGECVEFERRLEAMEGGRPFPTLEQQRKLATLIDRAGKHPGAP